MEAAVDDLTDLPAFFDLPGKRGFRAEDEEPLLDVLAQDSDVELFAPFRVALFFTFSEDERRPAGENSAEDAIVTAVNRGGDTDTIGAIAAAVAGARFGASQLPDRWLGAIDEVDELETLAERLVEVP